MKGIPPLSAQPHSDNSGRLEVRDILGRLHRLFLSASITREEVGA
jgi:hypothetical protein